MRPAEREKAVRLIVGSDERTPVGRRASTRSRRVRGAAIQSRSPSATIVLGLAPRPTARAARPSARIDAHQLTLERRQPDGPRGDRHARRVSAHGNRDARPSVDVNTRDRLVPVVRDPERPQARSERAWGRPDRNHPDELAAIGVDEPDRVRAEPKSRCSV